MTRGGPPAGAGLSPAAGRLLSAARPVRSMTSAERKRAAAFVRAVSDEPTPSLGSTLRNLWPRVAVALFFASLTQSSPGGAPDTSPHIIAEAPAPERDTDHGVSLATPFSREDKGDHRADVPGDGDVCGQRVCEQIPSCCENAWNAACDRKLLELTRSPGSATFTTVDRCYWHDREQCPGCACPMYLKRWEIMSRGGEPGVALGYDGGSGCLRDKAQLLTNLKWMCVEGHCEE